jgi:hypothetical protein
MDVLFWSGILLTGKTMKSFLERLAARDELGRVGGRCSFRDLGMGETAAPSHSASSSWPRGLPRGMRRGQDSPVNKLLKKPAREPWNERKAFMAYTRFGAKPFVLRGVTFPSTFGYFSPAKPTNLLVFTIVDKSLLFNTLRGN